MRSGDVPCSLGVPTGICIQKHGSKPAQAIDMTHVRGFITNHILPQRAQDIRNSNLFHHFHQDPVNMACAWCFHLVRAAFHKPGDPLLTLRTHGEG